MVRKNNVMIISTFVCCRKLELNLYNVKRNAQLCHQPKFYPGIGVHLVRSHRYSIPRTDRLVPIPDTKSSTGCAVINHRLSLGHYSLDVSFSSTARTKKESSRFLPLCHYSFLRMRKMWPRPLWGGVWGRD